MFGINFGNNACSVGFDPDALAYFTAVEDAGGTLTDNVKAEFDAFVLREKDAGRYSKLLRLYPFLGGVIDSAIIDAVTTNSATNNNFVDADVDPVIGIQGDNATKYIYDSPINTIYSSPYNIQQGDYNIVKRSGTSDKYYGVRDSSPASIEHRIGANFFQTWNPSTSFSTSKYSTILDNQWLSFARYNDSLSTVYVDDNTGSSTLTVSYTLSSLNQMVYGRNNQGSYNGSMDTKLGCKFMAEGMSESDLLAFQNSYKTFVNNITAYAAAQSYFTAVETAGGTLTTNVKSEFTSFVSREVEAGRWSKIKRLYPFLGATIDSAVIDAVTLNSATNTNFVDADVDATIGLQGDGSTKSLRLTETADNILPDSTDFQIGVFRIGAVEQSTSLSRLFGYLKTSNTANRLYLQKNQLQPQCFATDGVTAAGGVLSSNSSHIGASFSSTDLKVLLDGVVTSTSTTARSTSFGTESIDLFAFNVNGSPSGHSSINSGGYFIASGLTLSETQALESSYKTFINNITA